MNILSIIAGVLTLVGFVGHAFVASGELRLFAPSVDAGKARQEWVRSLAAYHWVSVDLLVATILFLAIGVLDVITQESTVLLALGGYFVAIGVVILATVTVAGGGVVRRYLAVWQWISCFIVAGLAFLAR